MEHERLFWVKTTQEAYFSKEISLLNQNKCLSNANNLSKFIPFTDSLGMLRIGGRLKNTLIDPEAKYPLLLPRESDLSTLIIADAHEKTLHGGAQIMLAFLRQSYWILGGSTPIKSYVLHSVRYTRLRCTTAYGPTTFNKSYTIKSISQLRSRLCRSTHDENLERPFSKNLQNLHRPLRVFLNICNSSQSSVLLTYELVAFLLPLQ